MLLQPSLFILEDSEYLIFLLEEFPRALTKNAVFCTVLILKLTDLQYGYKKKNHMGLPGGCDYMHLKPRLYESLWSLGFPVSFTPS